MSLSPILEYWFQSFKPEPVIVSFVKFQDVGTPEIGRNTACNLGVVLF